METPVQHHDYQRVAKAISYIYDNFKQQPTLHEIAAAVHLSPHHFQRIFTQWAGVSPKKFLQFMNLQFAKDLMKGGNFSLSDVAYEAGLSGTSRLHDLFISIEAMTPGVYKSGGKGLEISYGLYPTPLGQVVLASTSKGICKLSFVENKESAIQELEKEWPNASLQDDQHRQTRFIEELFSGRFQQATSSIKLHVKGTPFQLKVWEALLKIPEGYTTSYGTIAQLINQQNAVRAVGTAIGKNPVAILIPCHRVIKKVGGFGNYHWGTDRKLALLSKEYLHCYLPADELLEN